MKKYSMLSVVRKMQIKTKMRKLTPTRMAKIKKTDTYQMLDRTQSNRINNTLWVGVQKGTILWEKFWNFPIKSIIQLPYGTTIPYLGVFYTREIKTCSQKTCIRTFTIPKIFITIKNLEQPRWFSTGKWAVRHIYTTEYDPAKKSIKCNNMYESQDYGEWSLTKEHILYNSMYMKLKNEENVYVWEKNWNKGCLQEMGVGINWKRHEITLQLNSNVLYLDKGLGYTDICICRNYRRATINTSCILQAKSSQPLLFVNKSWLEHSHSHSFKYCIWLLSYYNSRAKQLQQRPHGSQSQKSFLSTFRQSLPMPGQTDKMTGLRCVILQNVSFTEKKKM